MTVMDEFANKMMEHMPEKVEADISTLILAPMPGMLKSVTAEVGKPVSQSDYNHISYLLICHNVWDLKKPNYGSHMSDNMSWLWPSNEKHTKKTMNNLIGWKRSYPIFIISLNIQDII